MTIVQVQFRKKSVILFKWAIFSVPAETTLFQLLDQIHSGMLFIFFFLVCLLYYFVVLFSETCRKKHGMNFNGINWSISIKSVFLAFSIFRPTDL